MKQTLNLHLVEIRDDIIHKLQGKKFMLSQAEPQQY